MNVFDRIETVRKQLRINKGEMCKQLGIGRTMLHYIKTGEREIGADALLILEEIESSLLSHRESESDARIAIAKNALDIDASETVKQLLGDRKMLEQHNALLKKENLNLKRSLTEKLKKIQIMIDEVLDELD